jgi:2-dehydropantoate 2-reductase
VDAGAAWCYFGGLLARGGYDVMFVGGQSYVDAINPQALGLDTPTFEGRAKAPAKTDVSSLGPSGPVLFCVKSADTESAGAALPPVLGPGTSIVSLQTGVNNGIRLSKAVGRPVIRAVVCVRAEVVGPGQIKQHGRDELVIGASIVSGNLAALLSEGQLPTTVSDKTLDVLWSKLISNYASNGSAAAANIYYRAVGEIDRAKNLTAAVVAKCVKVAEARDVSVPDDISHKLPDGDAKTPNHIYSTALDIGRGKVGKMDYLNGCVVRKGLELRTATPTNFALQVIVKASKRRHGDLRKTLSVL